jgi:tetratricopeptide (TPR) repeat protein
LKFFFAAPLPPMAFRLRIAALVVLASLVTAHAANDFNDPQAVLSLARSLIQSGRAPEVKILYERAATVWPADVKLRRDFARLMAGDKATRAEASKAYSEAAALAPQDAELAAEFAAFLASSGDSVSSALQYRRAFGLDPRSEAALSGYVRQMSHLGASPVAIRQASESLSRSPGDLPGRLLLGGLLLSEARAGDALDQFSSALRADPNSRIAARGVAEAYLALGFYDHAELLFSQAKEEAGRALADKARVLLASGRPEAALSVLSAGAGEVEKEPEALVVLSDAYRALGDAARERATLEGLLSLHGRSHVSALERLARAYSEAGDKDASRALCDQLLQADPKNPVGTFCLVALGAPPDSPPLVKDANTPQRRAGLDQEMGEAALFWGRPDEAAARLRRVLQQRPDSPRALLALGASLARAGDAAGAASAFAAAGDRGNLTALLGLAQAELQRGDAKGCAAVLRQALGYDADNFRAGLALAEAARRLGDDGRAVALLSDLARRAPESKSVRDSLRVALLALDRPYRSYARDGEGAPASLLLIPGDTVRVRVPGHAASNAEASLDEFGLLRLPYLADPIEARCMTADELGAEIERRGGAHLRGLPIEVAAVRLQRAALAVAGAVYTPGDFLVRKTLDLRESLMLASGTRPEAGRSVYVVRGAGTCGGDGQVEVYDRAASEEGRVRLERPLRAGDLVFVPEADAAFITGGVARPSVVAARGGLSLLRAVEGAGGTVEGARRDGVRLLRPLPDGNSYRQYTVDLGEIERERVGDVVLRPGDIVEVPAGQTGGGLYSLGKLLKHVAAPSASAAPADAGVVGARGGGERRP